MSSAPAPGTLTFAQAIALAQSHWQAGQAAQAETLCRRVLDVDPGQPDAHYLLALMAHAYGKREMAIDHLKKPATRRVHRQRSGPIWRRCVVRRDVWKKRRLRGGRR